MRVCKILNNNLVLSKNENNEEIIVKGRGIGFHARRGDRIDESMIEKIFYPENHQNSVQIQEYLLSIPEEYFDFTQRFVDRIKEENPDLQLNNSIYLSLSDHIMGTINRLRDGISLKNVLLLDIRQLYKKEYGFGERLVKELNEAFQIDLPLDEAGFMALHFVNAEYGTDIRDAFRFPNQLKDILEITSDELGIVLDERTLHYERFVTHLKFLLQRVYRRELLPNEEDELADLMRTKYPKEYACSRKIAEYIEKNTDCRLSGEEVMYLAIHIRRVTMAED